MIVSLRTRARRLPGDMAGPAPNLTDPFSPEPMGNHLSWTQCWMGFSSGLSGPGPVLGASRRPLFAQVGRNQSQSNL